jgi:hypothetical protein
MVKHASLFDPTIAEKEKSLTSTTTDPVLALTQSHSVRCHGKTLNSILWHHDTTFYTYNLSIINEVRLAFVLVVTYPYPPL